MSSRSIHVDDLAARSRARDTVKLMSRTLDAIADRCLSPEYTSALRWMVMSGQKPTESMFWLTGVGKSGYVAQRAASSWRSVGIRASYIDPINLRHGDVGGIRDYDLMFILSQSGETTEILDMISCVKEVTRIAITGNVTSTLARDCDVVLDSSPCAPELIPYQATIAQNAWCDALMAGWCSRTGSTINNNHPGGNIGRILRGEA